MDIELLRRWQRHKDRHGELKAELELVEKALEEMNEEVLNQFTNGITKVTVDGRNIFVRRECRPAPKQGRIELAAALKANGFGDIVREDYNANTLYSLTCEMIRNYEAELSPEGRITFVPDDAVPDGLKPFLTLHEVYKVTQRK